MCLTGAGELHGDVSLVVAFLLLVKALVGVDKIMEEEGDGDGILTNVVMDEEVKGEERAINVVA